jgi:hypothetical protein
VHRFIVDPCGFPVTITKVELAATAGELLSVRVAGKDKYSRRMALEWLEGPGVQIDWDLAEAAAEAERGVAEDADASPWAQAHTAVETLFDQALAQ